MEIFMLFVLFNLGMVVIIKGADLFIDSAIWIAARLNISHGIMGATVVSLATTLPELSVSVFASFTGHAEMSLGNAVGSNIFNIGCIMGLAFLIGGSKVERGKHLRHCTFMIGAAVIALVLALDGQISRYDGILLFIILVVNLLYLLRKSKPMSADHTPVKESEQMKGSFARNSFKFFIGTVAVVGGSRLTVGAGIGLAQFFGVPEIIIGLTLVAIGTSLPELVTAITSTLKGYQELSVGNILGAGLLNICWVTAASSIVRPIPIELANIVLDFPFMILLMVVFLAFGLIWGKFTRWHGIVLLFIYAMYLRMLFFGHM